MVTFTFSGIAVSETQSIVLHVHWPALRDGLFWVNSRQYSFYAKIYDEDNEMRLCHNVSGQWLYIHNALSTSVGTGDVTCLDDLVALSAFDSETTLDITNLFTAVLWLKRATCVLEFRPAECILCSQEDGSVTETSFPDALRASLL